MFAAQLKDAVDLNSAETDLASEPAHLSVWISQRD